MSKKAWWDRPPSRDVDRAQRDAVKRMRAVAEAARTAISAEQMRAATRMVDGYARAEGYARAKPRPPSPPPTFSECVVGHRSWIVDAYGLLRPLNAGGVWWPGVVAAACNRGRLHHAPAPDCTCGLYARHVLRPSAPPGCDLPIVPLLDGTVAAWGDLEVHRDGFRAQYACVTALGLPPGAPGLLVELIQKLAKTYRVAAVATEDLPLEGARFGAPLPDDAKPPLIDFGRARGGAIHATAAGYVSATAARPV